MHVVEQLHGDQLVRVLNNVTTRHGRAVADRRRRRARRERARESSAAAHRRRAVGAASSLVVVAPLALLPSVGVRASLVDGCPLIVAMDDDVTHNRHFGALRAHRRLMERARRVRLLVVVPVAASLPPRVDTSAAYARAHLLRDDYSSLAGVAYRLADDGTRLLAPDGDAVEVLGEELHYAAGANTALRLVHVSAPLVGVRATARTSG